MKKKIKNEYEVENVNKMFIQNFVSVSNYYDSLVTIYYKKVISIFELEMFVK